MSALSTRYVDAAFLRASSCEKIETERERERERKKVSNQRMKPETVKHVE